MNASHSSDDIPQPPRSTQETLARCLQFMGLLKTGIDTSVKATLKKKYYELALLMHPDKNGNSEDFIRLKECYSLLKEAATNQNALMVRLMTPQRPSPSPEDEIYRLYKEALKNYFEALEEYFEGKHQVELEVDSPAYQELCEKLNQVKSDLARVIQKNPAGMWVSDSIEKIGRINVWLGPKNNK